jgi:cell wall-associated NlpC family hydrolase
VKPFFRDFKRAESLRAESESWLGTPFVEHAAIKGAGVDCVNLCAEVLRRSGVLVPANRTWPSYSMDGGNHSARSKLRAWLEGQPMFELVWEPDRGPYALCALPGDVLVFHLRQSAHHAGLFIGGTKFIHSMFKRSVEMPTLADGSYGRRLEAAFRPMEI